MTAATLPPGKGRYFVGQDFRLQEAYKFDLRAFCSARDANAFSDHRLAVNLQRCLQVAYLRLEAQEA